MHPIKRPRLNLCIYLLVTFYIALYILSIAGIIIMDCFWSSAGTVSHSLKTELMESFLIYFVLASLTLPISIISIIMTSLVSKKQLTLNKYSACLSLAIIMLKLILCGTIILMILHIFQIYNNLSLGQDLLFSIPPRMIHPFSSIGNFMHYVVWASFELAFIESLVAGIIMSIACFVSLGVFKRCCLQGGNPGD
jgi:hypothetical protein